MYVSGLRRNSSFRVALSAWTSDISSAFESASAAFPESASAPPLSSGSPLGHRSGVHGSGMTKSWIVAGSGSGAALALSAASS